MAFSAIVDKTSLQAWFYAGNLTLVDIGFFLFPRRDFHVQIVKLLTIDHGHAYFLFLDCIDKYSLHLQLNLLLVPLSGHPLRSVTGHLV